MLTITFLRLKITFLNKKVFDEAIYVKLLLLAQYCQQQLNSVETKFIVCFSR